MLSGNHIWPRPVAADLLASALKIDMQHGKAEAGDEAAPSKARLVQAAQDLRKVLDGDESQAELPFGTPMIGGQPGSVEIAGRIYVRREHVAGLHAIEATPRRQRSSHRRSNRAGPLPGSQRSASCGRGSGAGAPRVEVKNRQ